MISSPFKIIVVLFVSTSFIFGSSNPNADIVKEAVNDWISKSKSSGQEIPDSQVPEMMAANLVQKIPDAQLRMEALIDYAAMGGKGAPFTVRMIWNYVAPSPVRAAFLNRALQSAPSDKIGYVSTFSREALVDAEVVSTNSRLEGASELEREVAYSGKDFIPLIASGENLSPRLLAIWFSKAPHQAALACLGGNDEKAGLQLRSVNALRYEMEAAKSKDQKEQVWRKLDHELALMMLSESPVLEMYAAGVLKWRRTVEASFSDSDSLTKAINKCSNPVVGCILKGINTETLTSLLSDKIILASTPNPIVAPTAAVEQATPAPPVSTSLQQPQSITSPSPVVQSEPSKSSPWQLIIGAMLLLAVAGGILLKLRRK